MFKARSLSEVRPRDVPGFNEAVAAGTVRPVPPTPPTLIPGPTAQRMFQFFLMKGAAAVAVVLIAIEVVPRTTANAAWSSLGILIVGLLGFWLIMRLWGNVGNRNAEELAHGYTTFQMQFGGFWWGEGRRWEKVNRRAPWDYAGIWILNGSGQVVSPPNFAVDAPGFYPSPNRRSALELWSGVVWTGQYRPHR